MEFIIGAVAQGLLWAVMAIGVYITYRILDIADLQQRVVLLWSRYYL